MILEDQLYSEFVARNNSFLIGIRGEIKWEHEKFINLIVLMKKYIIKTENDSCIDRNFLKGYWYFSSFIPQWTSHDNFRRKNEYSKEYYETAYKLILLLYNWFVNGNSGINERNREEYEEYLMKLTSIFEEGGYNT